MALDKAKTFADEHAAALLIAEIERLDRAELDDSEKSSDQSDS